MPTPATYQRTTAIIAEVPSHDTLVEALEALSDRMGMAAVIAALSEVCHLKAEHFCECWQDQAGGSNWDAVGDALAHSEHLARTTL